MRLQGQVGTAIGQDLTASRRSGVRKQLLVQLDDHPDQVLGELKQFGHLAERVELLHGFKSAEEGVHDWFRLGLHHCLQTLVHQLAVLEAFFLWLRGCPLVLGVVLPKKGQFRLNLFNLVGVLALHSADVDLERLNQRILLADHSLQLRLGLVALLLFISECSLGLAVELPRKLLVVLLLFAESLELGAVADQLFFQLQKQLADAARKDLVLLVSFAEHHN